MYEFFYSTFLYSIGKSFFTLRCRSIRIEKLVFPSMAHTFFFCLFLKQSGCISAFRRSWFLSATKSSYCSYLRPGSTRENVMRIRCGVVASRCPALMQESNMLNFKNPTRVRCGIGCGVGCYTTPDATPGVRQDTDFLGL